MTPTRTLIEALPRFMRWRFQYPQTIDMVCNSAYGDLCLRLERQYTGEGKRHTLVGSAYKRCGRIARTCRKSAPRIRQIASPFVPRRYLHRGLSIFRRPPVADGNGVATRFAVWAPRARRVRLLGDFNRWGEDDGWNLAPQDKVYGALSSGFRAGAALQIRNRDRQRENGSRRPIRTPLHPKCRLVQLRLCSTWADTFGGTPSGWSGGAYRTAGR